MPWRFDHLRPETTRVLLIPGLATNGDEFSALERELETIGAEVHRAHLRGHGLSPGHLFKVHWRDWLADSRQGLLKLSPGREKVAIGGQNIGAWLALILAAEFGDKVEKVSLITPMSHKTRPLSFLPLVKRISQFLSHPVTLSDGSLPVQYQGYRYVPSESWEQARNLAQITWDLLPKVKCPVDLFMSRRDPLLSPKTLSQMQKKLPSGINQIYRYQKSFRELLLDVESESVRADLTQSLLFRPV